MYGGSSSSYALFWVLTQQGPCIRERMGGGIMPNLWCDHLSSAYTYIHMYFFDLYFVNSVITSIRYWLAFGLNGRCLFLKASSDDQMVTYFLCLCVCSRLCVAFEIIKKDVCQRVEFLIGSGCLMSVSCLQSGEQSLFNRWHKVLGKH